MPPLRHLPPVHAPISIGSVLGRGGGGGAADLRNHLRERYEADGVVLAASGTHALQLALSLAREDTGRVAALLPAYTCYDLVSAANGAGMAPGLYDLDPETLLPAPAPLQRGLRHHPAAVVVVHHFGFPTPIAGLADEAAAAGAWLIEDAAQAQGGTLDGRRLGSLAPLSVLSFGRGKGWTGGGGGALLLRGPGAEWEDRLASRLGPPARSASTRFKLGAQWALARPWLYRLPSSLPWLGLGETRYVPPSPPRRIAAASAQAALASAPAAEAEASSRRANARRIRNGLGPRSTLSIPPERGEPGYLRLPVRAPGHRPEDVLPARASSLGVVRSYPRSLPSLPSTPTRLDLGPTPGADALAREVFTVPTHTLLREHDLQTIVELLQALERTVG